MRERLERMRIGCCAGVLVLAMSAGVMPGQNAIAGTEPKTILLWESGAPGAQGDEDIDKPSLTVYLPAGANATKTGVVVVPGGGYQHLAMDHEGKAIVEW